MTVRYFSLLSVVMPSLRGGRRKQRPRGRQRRIRSKSAPAVLRSPRRGKRKQWDEDAMLAALEAVRSGCSIKQAALEHGVPRTTLYDRHSYTGRSLRVWLQLCSPFFLARISGLMQYVAMRIKQFTPLPAYRPGLALRNRM